MEGSLNFENAAVASFVSFNEVPVPACDPHPPQTAGR